MPTSLPFRTLLTQFQSRYPMGCLTADLLTIHQGQYVVRATAKLGDTILATGMSSAPEIEMAEDRAKVRALEVLGLGMASTGATSLAEGLLAPSRSVVSVPEQPVSPPSAAVSKDQFSPAVGLTEPDGAWSSEQPMTASHLLPETKPSLSKGLSHAATVPLESTLSASLMRSVTEESRMDSDSPALAQAITSANSTDPVNDHPSDEIDGFAFPTDLPASLSVSNHAAFSTFEPSSVDVLPVSETTTALSDPGSAKPEKTGKSTKRKASTVEPPPAPSARQPADRSEEIMKIGIEMKRLGWSTEQGREYLKRTYGKRSRQELDDAELLDFLRYLETQPAAIQAPF